MAVKLSETDLPQLLPWLEPHRPLCFRVYGKLKSHMKGLIPDLQFFVDRWPHPQALVAREDPAGGQMMSMIGAVSVFGVDDKALSSLLKDPAAVHWNQVVILCAIPSSLKSAALAAAREKEKSVTQLTTILMQGRPRDVMPIPIPEGLKVQPISEAEIKIIHSTWRFSHYAKESYIQNNVEKYPSIYVVTENGDHVGHMVGTSHGVMGMLYVNPEFRRKGYAKVIVTQLSQKYFDRGEDAYVGVDEDHVSTQSLFKSCGFKEATEIRFVYLTTD